MLAILYRAHLHHQSLQVCYRVGGAMHTAHCTLDMFYHFSMSAIDCGQDPVSEMKGQVPETWI